jgi:hypothetical protein
MRPWQHPGRDGSEGANILADRCGCLGYGHADARETETFEEGT